MKKKVWLIIQFAIVLLIILQAFLQSRVPYQTRSFDPTNSYYMTMGEYFSEENAYYVDETTGQSGIFTCGPYITLPAGIYDVTVLYECSEEGNICYADSEDSVYFANAMNRDEIALNPVYSSQTFRFKLNKRVEDFEIQTYYSGKGSLLVKGFSIHRGRINIVHTIFLQLCIVLLLNLVVSILVMMKQKRFTHTQLLTGLALCGIILFSSLPLLKEGFPRYTTDLNFILMRIEGLKDGLLSGDFPVRVQPNWLNGYGYATSIFYSDIFLYLPAFLRVLGVSVQNAYFMYQFTFNILTCLLSYYCFKRIFDYTSIALIGSALYTLSTYRLMLLYYTTRGGMFTAYAFLPLILYGVYLIYSNPKDRKSWLYTSLGMTALLHCHLLSAEMVFLSLVVLIILSAHSFFRKDSFLAMVKAVFVSIGFNIGFLVPMFDYMGQGFYVSSESWKRIYNYIQKFGLDCSGFLNLFRDEDSYHAPDFILICGLFFFLLLLLFLPRFEEKETKVSLRTAGSYSAFVSIVLLFLSTKYFPWDAIEERFKVLRMPINSIQYPNRFIEIALLTMTFTFCCGLHLLHREKPQQWYRTTIMGLLIIFGISSGWMMSNILNLKSYTSVYDAKYLDTCNISTKEYLPEGSDPANFILEGPNAEVGIEISDFHRKGTHLTLQCNNLSGKDSLIELPLVFYRDYKAISEEGAALTLLPSEQSTLLVVVPKDYHGEIRVSFHQPLSWTIAFWFSVLFGVGVIIRSRRPDEKPMTQR